MIRSVCLSRNRILQLSKPRLGQVKQSTRLQATIVAEATTTDSPVVARWLYCIAGSALVAVVLGGATRLTESGLSMTSWHLIKDITKPTTEEEWKREFERYKTFPEYEEVHSELTLDGFKFIYHMEWGHRNWGRVIGVAFMLPLFYFLATGRLSPQSKKRCIGLMGLLGFQGGLGWYMVKSGLEKNPDLYGQVRVSPYRLCAHLGTAFVFIVSTLWTALDISVKNKGAPALPDHKLVNVLKKKSMAMAAFRFFVAMSGAFVAGNDAGLIYNTYPMMADRWFPSDYFHPYMNPIQNLFENGTAVQFNHRFFAHVLAFGMFASWMMARKAGLVGGPMMAANLMMAATAGQFTLGVLTLLNGVPVALGTAHQFGSVVLLSSSVAFAHQLRRGKIDPRLAKKILSK
jgi:cytochrome c oxidase assembly protein subunit 15